MLAPAMRAALIETEHRDAVLAEVTVVTVVPAGAGGRRLLAVARVRVAPAGPSWPTAPPDIFPWLPLRAVDRVELPRCDARLDADGFALQQWPLWIDAALAAVAVPIARVASTGTPRPHVAPVPRVALPILPALTSRPSVATAAPAHALVGVAAAIGAAPASTAPLHGRESRRRRHSPTHVAREPLADERLPHGGRTGRWQRASMHRPSAHRIALT